MPLEVATKPAELNPAWPLGTDPRSQGDDHIRMLKQVMLNMFPIGTILENTSGINPGDHLGGVWEAWGAGVVTVGAGTYTPPGGTSPDDDVAYTAGDEGGEIDHQLVASEVPAHSHGKGTLDTEQGGIHKHGSNGSILQILGGGGQFDGLGSGPFDRAVNMSTIMNNSPSHKHGITGQTASAGGDQPHNNMQPYVVVHKWRRTG